MLRIRCSRFEGQFPCRSHKDGTSFGWSILGLLLELGAEKKNEITDLLNPLFASPFFVFLTFASCHASSRMDSLDLPDGESLSLYLVSETHLRSVGGEFDLMHTLSNVG